MTSLLLGTFFVGLFVGLVAGLYAAPRLTQLMRDMDEDDHE